MINVCIEKKIRIWNRPLRSDQNENKSDSESDFVNVPGSGGTAGHHRGTITGTLLASRDTASNKEEALGLELLSAADGIGEVRVASVNDDITSLEERQDLGNEVVDGLAGLDEHHDLAGTLQLLAELLDRVSANDLGALGLVGQEVVNLGDGSVVGADGVTVVVHVEDQVLTLIGERRRDSFIHSCRHNSAHRTMQREGKGKEKRENLVMHP